MMGYMVLDVFVHKNVRDHIRLEYTEMKLIRKFPNH